VAAAYVILQSDLRQWLLQQQQQQQQQQLLLLLHVDRSTATLSHRLQLLTSEIPQYFASQHYLESIQNLWNCLLGE
jgi:hypothetical protein